MPEILYCMIYLQVADVCVCVTECQLIADGYAVKLTTIRLCDIITVGVII